MMTEEEKDSYYIKRRGKNLCLVKDTIKKTEVIIEQRVGECRKDFRKRARDNIGFQPLCYRNFLLKYLPKS